jgi:hypothetical protein
MGACGTSWLPQGMPKVVSIVVNEWICTTTQCEGRDGRPPKHTHTHIHTHTLLKGVKRRVLLAFIFKAKPRNLRVKQKRMKIGGITTRFRPQDIVNDNLGL